jgi:hypothetical protein
MPEAYGGADTEAHTKSKTDHEQEPEELARKKERAELARKKERAEKGDQSVRPELQRVLDADAARFNAPHVTRGRRLLEFLSLSCADFFLRCQSRLRRPLPKEPATNRTANDGQQDHDNGQYTFHGSILMQFRAPEALYVYSPSRNRLPKMRRSRSRRTVDSARGAADEGVQHR